MSNTIPLKNAAIYVEERTDLNSISYTTFVSVDNLLQNKLGRTDANGLPPKGNSFPSYKVNDILIGNIRPYLKKIWFADRDGGSTQDVLILRAKTGYDQKFLYYSLFRDDFFVHMMNGKKGTKMPRGDRKQVLDFLIPHYSLPIQQRIAAVLSSLDAKIELNNKINRELEAAAKTLYDYWFVQFNFPDKNGKPYKSSGGKMVWNGQLKREIPEGWSSTKILDLIDTENSGDWGKDSPDNNYSLKTICIRGADINGLNGLEELKPPTRYILEKNSSKFLKAHDMIIEISGGSPTQSTGRLAIITDSTIKRFSSPLICSNFCKPISIRNIDLFYFFAFYWNSLYENDVFFGHEGKTTGIKNLLFDSFINSHYIVIPEEIILNQFYNLMDNIQMKKQKVLSENQQLSSLRDWLLPMLMNGQVTVQEAEERISMVAEQEVEYGE